VSDKGDKFSDVGPFVRNPPAYTNLNSINVTTNAIITSSADSFDAGGFNYDPTASLNTPLNSLPVGNNVLELFRLIFTIPVCTLDYTYAWTPNIQSFQDSLVSPDHQTGAI
jgi:hypothetical protein